MAIRRYGINPLLISLVTGQELAEIPDSPSARYLPGKYGKTISKIIADIPNHFSENRYKLACTQCGKNAEYDLGQIAFDMEKYSKMKEFNEAAWSEKYQFTGYFRCKHCNAAGPWQMPEHTSTTLTIATMAAMLQTTAGLEKDNFIFGRMETSEGLFFPLTTDVEEYYLDMLKQNPSDAWIWNRLGNAYYKGGRPDLAVVAYEESVNNDPGQTESHYSLGRILDEVGITEDAVLHLREMLITARHYERMEPLQLRDLLTAGLHILFDIKEDPKEMMDFLLEGEKDRPQQSQNNKSMHYVELDITFDEFEGLYPLAEIYMNKGNLKGLSGKGMHPKMKKPPKKKGRRKVKKK